MKFTVNHYHHFDDALGKQIAGALSAILKGQKMAADNLADVKTVLDNVQAGVNAVGTDVTNLLAKVAALQGVDPTARQAILDEGNAIVTKLQGIDTSVNPPAGT